MKNIKGISISLLAGLVVLMFGVSSHFAAAISTPALDPPDSTGVSPTFTGVTILNDIDVQGVIENSLSKVIVDDELDLRKDVSVQEIVNFYYQGGSTIVGSILTAIPPVTAAFAPPAMAATGQWHFMESATFYNNTAFIQNVQVLQNLEVTGKITATEIGTYSTIDSGYVGVLDGNNGAATASCPANSFVISCAAKSYYQTPFGSYATSYTVPLLGIYPDTSSNYCTAYIKNTTGSTRYLKTFAICHDPQI